MIANIFAEHRRLFLKRFLCPLKLPSELSDFGVLRLLPTRGLQGKIGVCPFGVDD